MKRNPPGPAVGSLSFGPKPGTVRRRGEKEEEERKEGEGRRGSRRRGGGEDKEEDGRAKPRQEADIKREGVSEIEGEGRKERRRAGANELKKKYRLNCCKIKKIKTEIQKEKENPKLKE